ncbi:MAG: hypothetical protein GXO74_02150 [Calditrichaeota bacterium]|nr:hypothetical protein [Calditrichota bacterium]
MTKRNFILLIFFSSQLILGLTKSSAEEKNTPETIHWDISKIKQVGTITPIINSYDKVWDFILDDFDNDFQQEIGILRSDDNNPFFLFVREIDTYSLTFDTGISLRNHLDSNNLIELHGSKNYRCLTYRIDKDRGYVDIYNSRLKPTQSIQTICGKDRNGNGNWDGNLDEAELTDLNSDGRKDLLVGFNTGADGYPRALLGYDLFTKENIFAKYFAPMLHFFQTINVDDNPTPQIVVALAGASDGRFFGEFRRDSSYLTILNNDGSVLKKWAYLGESSYVCFDMFDINGDHVLDIISGCYSRRDNGQIPSFLRIIDGKSLKVLCEYELENIALKPAIIKILDLEYDGDPKIVVLDEEGNTGLFHYNKFSHSIELINFSDYYGEKFLVLNDDLNGDGFDELFFTCSNPPSIVITDNKLRPLCFFPTETFDKSKKDIFRLNSSTNEEAQYIFLSNHKLFKASIPVEEIFPPLPFRFNWLGLKLNWGIGKFLGLILFILAVILLPGLYFFRQKNAIGIPESNRVGCAIMNQSGKIKKYNHTFLKLTHLHPNDLHKSIHELTKQNSYFRSFDAVYAEFVQSYYTHFYKEINIGFSGKRKIFGLELFRMKYNRSKSPMLFLVIDLSETKASEQARIWASMAQRVAHKIKTPLGTILLAIQRLQRKYQKNASEFSSEYNKLANTAISEIERVRETINVFMKIARLDSPNFQKGELNNILKDTLQEYRRRLPEGVRIEVNYDENALNVKIDDKHFKEAIFNIFDNAVTAMGSHGQLKISTNLETHPLQDYGGQNSVTLEIADDGKGMSEEELQNLFTPGFTTSEHGSGMGLVISKNIIQNHNGKIDIHSRKGVGTTVTINLPLLDK